MKITLGELADQFDLQLIGDAAIEVSGIANLEDAQAHQLSFLFSAAYKKYLSRCSAAAVVVSPADQGDCELPRLVADEPRLIWAKIANLFDNTPIPSPGIHPTATIADDVVIGKDVAIAANAVIEQGAVLSNGVSVGAGCYIGTRVNIGEGSRLHANVTVYHDVQIGKKCLLHSGSVLGADGFGFQFSAGELVKIPQIYSVLIGNNVEIGAGSTIDRGALRHTEVGNGVKIDNQVVIGHGTQVGNHTAISGASAIAGSTRIGAYCLIGGAVGIVDNIEIVDQVEITAMTLVSQSITRAGRYSSGTGLMAGRDWKRSIVGFRRLDELMKRISKLEKK